MSVTDNELQDMPGDQMGPVLTGAGFNLLVKNIARSVDFASDILLMTIVRADEDFAVLRYQSSIILLHVDGTYHENEMLSLLPESGPRGAGVELRLYGLDPDAAEQRAIEADYMVLRSCSDRPHGLRECYILDPDGYCWVPGIPSEQKKD